MKYRITVEPMNDKGAAIGRIVCTVNENELGEFTRESETLTRFPSCFDFFDTVDMIESCESALVASGGI